MKLGEVFYAAITPDGELLKGAESQANGLYNTPGKAQGILTKKLKWANKCVANYHKALKEKTELSTYAEAHYKHFEVEAIRLSMAQIQQVKVVLV